MGEFEVSDYYEMPSRGAFVLGNILQGRISPGMYVETGCEPATLRISGVECLDDLRNNRHWNALVFAERPSLDLLKRAMPVGTIVLIKDVVETSD